MDNFINNLEGKVPENMMDGIIEKMEENSDAMKNLIKGLWMSPIFAIVVSAIISLFIKKDATAQS